MNAPIRGELYRRPGLRGRWRVETAGPKCVKLRSLEVVGRGGWFVIPRELWPDSWERA